MNKIVKAENEKIAAVDFATAAETTALQNNAKIIVPANQQLVNVIGDMAGITGIK